MLFKKKSKGIRGADGKGKRKGCAGAKGVDSSRDAWWNYVYDNFDMRFRREVLE